MLIPNLKSAFPNNGRFPRCCISCFFKWTVWGFNTLYDLQLENLNVKQNYACDTISNTKSMGSKWWQNSEAKHKKIRKKFTWYNFWILENQLKVVLLQSGVQWVFKKLKNIGMGSPEKEYCFHIYCHRHWKCEKLWYCHLLMHMQQVNHQ